MIEIILKVVGGVAIVGLIIVAGLFLWDWIKFTL